MALISVNSAGDAAFDTKNPVDKKNQRHGVSYRLLQTKKQSARRLCNRLFYFAVKMQAQYRLGQT